MELNGKMKADYLFKTPLLDGVNLGGIWEVHKLLTEILLIQSDIKEKDLQEKILLELLEKRYSDVVHIAKTHEEIAEKVTDKLSKFIKRQDVDVEERKIALKYLIKFSSEILDELRSYLNQI